MGKFSWDQLRQTREENIRRSKAMGAAVGEYSEADKLAELVARDEHEDRGSWRTGGRISDHDPLDLIETDEVIAPVVKTRRARALVGRHRLGDLELAAIL